MRRPTRKREYRSMADINIANLVDVVLVLLIIFMISAPLLQSGIDVELPQTRAAAINEETSGVVVTIDSVGGVFVNDEFANPDVFEQKLQDEMLAKNTNSVYVRGDKKIAYGNVIQLIAQIKDMGIANVSLVTVPPDAKDE